jgi:hypothetical protein
MQLTLKEKMGRKRLAIPRNKPLSQSLARHTLRSIPPHHRRWCGGQQNHPIFKRFHCSTLAGEEEIDDTALWELCGKLKDCGTRPNAKNEDENEYMAWKHVSMYGTHNASIAGDLLEKHPLTCRKERDKCPNKSEKGRTTKTNRPTRYVTSRKEKGEHAPKIQEILKNDIFKRLVVDAAKMLWEIDQKAVVFILLLLPPEVLLFDGVYIDSVTNERTFIPFTQFGFGGVSCLLLLLHVGRKESWCFVLIFVFILLFGWCSQGTAQGGCELHFDRNSMFNLIFQIGKGIDGGATRLYYSGVRGTQNPTVFNFSNCQKDTDGFMGVDIEHGHLQMIVAPFLRLCHGSTNWFPQPDHPNARRGCLGFYTDRRVIEHFLQFKANGEHRSSNQWKILNNQYHFFCKKYGRLAEVTGEESWGLV